MGPESFSPEVVAVLLVALDKQGIKLGKAHYDMMSALDGTRGSSAFEHDFRDVKKRAQELSDEIKAGKTFEPVKPTKNTKKPAGKNIPANKVTKNTTPTKKRGTGAKVKESLADAGNEESPTIQEKKAAKKTDTSFTAVNEASPSIDSRPFARAKMSSNYSSGDFGGDFGDYYEGDPTLPQMEDADDDFY